MLKPYFDSVHRKLLHLRLQPIRVFCFHQVSETFDPNVYCKPDWISMDFFKSFIKKLQNEGYEFISLEAAYNHIKNDKIRLKKYAVLTADDGLKCQLELLPWLEEHRVPITLFVNTETLDGKTCNVQIKNYFHATTQEEESEHAKALYFTKGELFSVRSRFLFVGLHGVTHDVVYTFSIERFVDQYQKCKSILSSHPNYVPFYAYPHGVHNSKYDDKLLQNGSIPVLADGEKNFNDERFIHREIIEKFFQSHK